MLTVDRKALVAAFTALKAIVPAKTTPALLSNVHVRRFSNGSLEIAATDLTTWATLALPVEGEDTGEGLLNLHAMQAAAKATKDARLSIHINGGGFADVGAMRLPFEPDASAFPRAPGVPYHGSVEWDSFALDKIAHVLPACGTDVTRPDLMGVKFEGGFIVGTDGHRLHLVAGVPTPEGAPIVPASALRLMARLSPGGVAVTCGVQGGVTTLHAGGASGAMWGVVVTVKCVDGWFPEWRQVIPTWTDANAEARVVFDREALRDALAPHVAMKARGIATVVEVTPEGGAILTTKADGTETRTTVEGSPITRGSATWGVNPRYVADALDALDGVAHVTLAVAKGEPLAPFEVAGGSVGWRGEPEACPGFRCVIMPMRI